MKTYPTDEELSDFISRMEEEPLYAPAHLKADILKSLEQLTAQERFGQMQYVSTATVQPLNCQPGGQRAYRRKQARVQMLGYGLKVAAGMAAALFLVFFLPRLPHLSAWQEEPRYEAWLLEQEVESRWDNGGKLATAADMEAEYDYWLATGSNNPFGAVLNQGTAALNRTSDELYLRMQELDFLFGSADLAESY